MLDNLANVDLSGIHSYIDYTYSNMGSEVATAMIGLGVFIFLISLIGILHRFVVGSKSQQYKEFLADMWVVGKIKQLAEKDTINLVAEEKEFLTRRKREKIYNQSLVATVEDDIKEKVAGLEEQAKPKK